MTVNQLAGALGPDGPFSEPISIPSARQDAAGSSDNIHLSICDHAPAAESPKGMDESFAGMGDRDRAEGRG